MYASLLIWLAILLSAILPLVFFLLRLSGHVLSINSIRPISLRYVRYARQKLYTISTSSIHIKLHLPRPREPHWAKILVQNYQYRDPECSVSISTIKITLWFFPMLFRFTAGPLITLQFEDFRLHVYNSTYTPKWVRKLGDNLIYTAINEETVRLHQFKPRFVLNGLTVVTGSKERFDGPIEKPGMRPGQELDDFKINGRAQQWHIHNKRNNRMYTYNSLETELRRSSAEDRQTLVIIARESKWTKLPLVGHFHDVSLLQCVFSSSLRQTPIYRMYLTFGCQIRQTDAHLNAQRAH